MSSVSKASRLIPRWKHIPIHPVLEGPSRYSILCMSYVQVQGPSYLSGPDYFGLVFSRLGDVVPTGGGRAIAEMQVSRIDIRTAREKTTREAASIFMASL